MAFIAPDTAATREVLGFDAYGNARFRDAIESARRGGQTAITPPFDLSEGGRGYVLFRVIDVAGKAGAPSTEHVVSIVIRADRLLSDLRLPAGMRLSLRVGDMADARGWIGSVGEAEPNAGHAAHGHLRPDNRFPTPVVRTADALRRRRRRRERDGRIDTFKINDPQSGLRSRAANACTLGGTPVGCSGVIAMPLPGTGITAYMGTAPASFFGLSVAKP